MTLTEFLLARLDEDEAAAKAAVMEGHEWGGARWMVPVGYQSERVCIDIGTPYGGSTVVYDEGSPSEEQAAHIARHDPARVLADVEAKRRIVEHFTWDDLGDEVSDPEGVLAYLALPYADDPQYREEWRP